MSKLYWEDDGRGKGVGEFGQLYKRFRVLKLIIKKLKDFIGIGMF